jgi:hypothetical protein
MIVLLRLFVLRELVLSEHSLVQVSFLGFLDLGRMLLFRTHLLNS